mgnify:CR=1 FL=1
MKILVLSEMTIFSEIKKICENKNIAIDKKIIIEINPLADSCPPIGASFNSVIFQSKNAVIYSKNWWGNIKKENPVVYCLGKYTGNLIKKYLNIDAIYPKDESSSENLAKIIHAAIPKIENDQKNYIIFCGTNGRSVIRQMLIENKQSVYVLEVYGRKESQSVKITEQDLDKNNVNYIIVSSRFALKVFLSKTAQFIKNYKITYIVPNKRVVHNIKNINEAIVVDNSNNAACYVDAILKNEE